MIALVPGFAVALIAIGIVWAARQAVDAWCARRIAPRVAPTPRLDHVCDVYAGAVDERERMAGLYLADLQLKAAEKRAMAA
jgi:hypothetical protein